MSEQFLETGAQPEAKESLKNSPEAFEEQISALFAQYEKLGVKQHRVDSRITGLLFEEDIPEDHPWRKRQLEAKNPKAVSDLKYTPETPAIPQTLPGTFAKEISPLIEALKQLTTEQTEIQAKIKDLLTKHKDLPQAYYWQAFYINKTGDGTRGEMFQLFRQAYEQKDPRAQYWLANHYRYTDPKKAFELLLLAAAAGYPEAQFILGYDHERGEDGLTKNFKAAKRLFESAAAQGHLKSLLHLGDNYEWGAYDVQQDIQTAIDYYKQAVIVSEQKADHHAEAHFRLGKIYANGKGVEKDLKEAAKWYRAAAENGDVAAQRIFGDYCAQGIGGVEKDEKQAVYWYRLAASWRHIGDTKAQYNLVRCYATGTGVEKDEKKALRWLQIAAQRHHTEAQLQLGHCYEEGRWGAVKDAKNAVVWYRTAAAQGNGQASYEMGRCYQEGIGLLRDFKEARKNYQLAESRGYTAAGEALEKLKNPSSNSNSNFSRSSGSSFNFSGPLVQSGTPNTTEGEAIELETLTSRRD